MERIKLVGLEREGWANDGDHPADTSSSVRLMNGVNIGELGSDAGLGLYEAITYPANSFKDALHRLQTIELQLGRYMVARTSFRPDTWGGHGTWVDKPRYRAMRRACEIERGSVGLERINIMTDMAAVHVNISGDFNPVGPDGLFVRNVLTNVAPFLCSRIHRDLGHGAGRLSYWADFADARRFPAWQQWFATPEEYQTFFEGIPRLLRCEAEEWIPRPEGEFQELGNALDHGVSWHLVRPKPCPGGWYLEIRLLPSMEDNDLEVYGEILIHAVEVLLQWFADKGGVPITTREESIPALKQLSLYYPDLFPEAPLSEAEWGALLRQ